MNKNKIFNNDWLNFWDSFQRRDYLTVWAGAAIIVFAGLGIGYIGTKRVTYAKNFYSMVFILNFLEDIRPGTKIRYQGALVVGEVEYIESSFHEHKIHVRIKKGFLIPKLGSRITIQTWGYFGGKFINISILNSHLEADAYGSGANVYMEPVTNSTIIMSKYFEIINKPNGNKLSPLEKNIISIKKMTNRILASSYANPKFMRRYLFGVMIDTKNYLLSLKNYGLVSHKAMVNVNDIAESTVGQLRKVLPSSTKRILKLQSLLSYPNKKNALLFSKFWHEESGYFELLEGIKYVNKRIKYYRESPYTIIFTEQ